MGMFKGNTKSVGAFEQYPFKSSIKRGTNTEAETQTCMRETSRQILCFLVCGLHTVCLVTFLICTQTTSDCFQTSQTGFV